MAKLALELTNYKILLITYTHHALDDALSHLCGVGVSPRDIVRLGSKAKATELTAQMALSDQNSGYKRSKFTWDLINKAKYSSGKLQATLESAFHDYLKLKGEFEDFKELWEFSDDDACFFEAFDFLIQEDGFQTAGRHGRKMTPQYLFYRWTQGLDAGALRYQVPSHHNRIWAIPPVERTELINKWSTQLIEDRIADIRQCATEYNAKQDELAAFYEDYDTEILLEKRVIACTTTAAAKYHRTIQAAKPDILLVEEAGEILESHVLTALTPTVKHLVLIGDHKQLRPKVNNYALTVEKGDGYDLNMSLFERLILQGMDHVSLQLQHRSHPDISLNIRELTYPHLKDGDKTSCRPPIRGLQDRLCFVNHGKLEDDESRLKERRDPTMKASKKNTYEALVVLRCVRYLVQQGYTTDDIVVLTPYLGQLYVLKDTLSAEHDPWLDDADSHELFRAGLITDAASKVKKKSLRISTIGS